MAAALIDRNGLEFYKDIRGPVFEKNLPRARAIGQLPAGRARISAGRRRRQIVDQFKTGLLKVHTIPEGKDMMKSWNVDEFQPVPADYAKNAAALLKAYPPPTGPK